MAKQSAGLLMYRQADRQLEVLLVHPGGPFWKHKDEGAWTLPKGELADGEEPLAAAQREFHEETGLVAEGPFQSLGTVKQGSGKIVFVWAFEGDCDPELLRSNTCEIEWPPRSGRKVTIPEVDRGAWFPLLDARRYLLKAQVPFLEALGALEVV